MVRGGGGGVSTEYPGGNPRHPERRETTCRDDSYRNEHIEVGASRCSLNRLSEIRLDLRQEGHSFYDMSSPHSNCSGFRPGQVGKQGAPGKERLTAESLKERIGRPAFSRLYFNGIVELRMRSSNLEMHSQSEVDLIDHFLASVGNDVAANRDATKIQ